MKTRCKENGTEKLARQNNRRNRTNEIEMKENMQEREAEELIRQKRIESLNNEHRT